MVRRLFRNFSFVALLVTAAVLGGAATAGAAGVTEGSFESGTLNAWRAASFYGKNLWASQAKAEAEASFETALPAELGPYVAATRYGGTDTSYLSQEIQLPETSKLSLSLYLFYKSTAPIAVPSPDTLFVKSLEGAPGGNQQVRVDVLKPNAPLESLSPNDILATLYASPTGAPERLSPTLVSADLSQFAGQTVTLRVADAVSDGPLAVGVGDVSLAVSPLAPPVAEPTVRPDAGPGPGPVAGKLRRDLVSGGAQLSVALPGPGQLIVADAHRGVAVASTFAAPRTAVKPEQVLIRTESRQTLSARTVHVQIRPAPAAKKLLEQNGRLPIRLQLTFTPTDGAVTTGVYKGVLMMRLSRTRR